MNDQTDIAQARAYFERCRAPDLVAVYLFGSVARGTSRPDSDVDIGILYTVPPPATLAGLPIRVKTDLEAVLNREVQIVILNSASADLVHRVLRDGQLIYETDRSARIGFEVRARQVFLDMRSVRMRYRRQDPGRVPEGA